MPSRAVSLYLCVYVQSLILCHPDRSSMIQLHQMPPLPLPTQSQPRSLHPLFGSNLVDICCHSGHGNVHAAGYGQRMGPIQPAPTPPLYTLQSLQSLQPPLHAQVDPVQSPSHSHFHSQSGQPIPGKTALSVHTVLSQPTSNCTMSSMSTIPPNIGNIDCGSTGSSGASTESKSEVAAKNGVHANSDNKRSPNQAKPDDISNHQQPSASPKSSFFECPTCHKVRGTMCSAHKYLIEFVVE